MANAAALSAVNGAYSDPRVRAFLDGVVRPSEASTGDAGYFQRWGGTFSDLSHHPGINTCIYIPRLNRTFCSDAAGAYQFLGSTWRGIVNALGLPDFSRDSQFRGAIYLLLDPPLGNGSLSALQNNDIQTAIIRSRGTWPSLPGGSQALKTRTMASAVAQYNAALGNAPVTTGSAAGATGTPGSSASSLPADGTTALPVDNDMLLIIVAGLGLLLLWQLFAD